MPIGMIDNLPIGMYLFAKRGREDILLKVMAAWEAVQKEMEQLQCVKANHGTS